MDARIQAKRAIYIRLGRVAYDTTRAIELLETTGEMSELEIRLDNLKRELQAIESYREELK